MRRFFVKRPTFLAATSNLRVDQNLVRLDRLLHFSGKVVGMTLSGSIYMQISTKGNGNLVRVNGNSSYSGFELTGLYFCFTGPKKLFELVT